MDILDKQIKIKRFFKTIFRDIDFSKEKIRVFQNNKDNSYNRVLFFTDIDELVSFSTNKSNYNLNTYFQLATLHIDAQDGKEDSLAHRYCLAFDFDKKDLGEGFNHKDILLKFKEIGLWYHAIIDSGNGYHVYIMIEKTDDIDKVNEVQRVLCNKLNADQNAIKTTQIFRAPYTYNIKDKPKTVRIINQFDRNTIKPYSINKLHSRFCSRFSNTEENSKNMKYIFRSNVPMCIENALKKGSLKGYRNKDLYNIVVYLKNKNENINQIKNVCIEWNNKNKEQLNKNELEYQLDYIYNNCNGFKCNECDKNVKIECKNYVESDFNLEQYGENIINIIPKVGRQCRDSKRKGVVNLNGNELFIYNVLLNNKDILLDKDGIMKLITDRKTKKVALNEKYVRESLKSLADKKYITIIRGTKKLGVSDSYVINKKNSSVDNAIKVSYFANIMVIKGHITTTELRCYMRMRYLHHEEIKKGKAKGNIFTITMEELAKDLGTDKAHVSRYIKNLYDNMILDRRAIPLKDNPKQFYYQYKLNM